MKPDHSGFSALSNLPGLGARQTAFLPGAKRKAATREEFIRWAKSAEMKPVFEGLAHEAVRMKQYLGSEHVLGKRALWVLLTTEAVCRQEWEFLLQPAKDADVLEGIRIVGDLLLDAARVDGRSEPLENEDFWRSFLLNLCVDWGAAATELKLASKQLYSVQLRRNNS